MSSLHVWRRDAPLIATCECGSTIAPRYMAGSTTCSDCVRARRKAAERAAEVEVDAFELRVRRITSGASYA
jgi:hypothetical protein